MAKSFEDRVVAAVRVTGPDAYPSAVLYEIDGGRFSFWGTSIGRLMFTLQRLSAEGILSERFTVDDLGRDRRVYSMGTGRRRPVAQPQSGHLSFA